MFITEYHRAAECSKEWCIAYTYGKMLQLQVHILSAKHS